MHGTILEQGLNFYNGYPEILKKQLSNNLYVNLHQPLTR